MDLALEFILLWQWNKIEDNVLNLQTLFQYLLIWSCVYFLCLLTQFLFPNVIKAVPSGDKMQYEQENKKQYTYCVNMKTNSVSASSEDFKSESETLIDFVETCKSIQMQNYSVFRILTAFSLTLKFSI